jgi:hypothetical protein
MQSTVAEARSKVHQWAQGHREAVLYDDENSALLDVFSGRSVFVPWGDLKAFEEKAHPETNDNYLVLLFDSGTQIALVDPGGVAFTPSDVNTGPLRDLPPVACLRDFYTLKQRIDHYLVEHRDEPVPREALDLLMICIAILDGARAVGFDVGELEQELEEALREIERRKG